MVTVRMSPAMPIVGDRLTVNVKRLRFRLLSQNSSTNTLALAKGTYGFLILQPENGETLQDNVIVRAVSSDPSRLLLARTQEAEPGTLVNIAVAANSNSSSTGLWVHALDSTGTAEIRLSAEGFEDSVATISFDPVRLAWAQPTVEIRAGQQYDASVYFENRGFAAGLSPRSGPLQLALRLDPVGIATLSSPTLAIAPGANFGSVTVTARSPGTFALLADLPPGVTAADGLQSIRAEVKVRALQISGYCPPQSRLGKDLTASCQILLPPGTGFTVTSSNPAALALSHAPTIVGSGSLSGSILVNGGSANIFMQGLASSGEATVTVRADGYDDLALKVTLAPTSLLFTADVELNRGAVLVQDDMKIRVTIATLGDTGAPQVTGQVLRAGAGPLVVPLRNSNSAVIRVQPASATIAVGESNGEVLVAPVGAGTSILTMQPPSGWLVNGTGSVLFDVQLKPLPFAWLWPQDTDPLPKNLVSGVFNTAFQPGIPITISTSDPSKMLVQLYSGGGEVVTTTSTDLKEFLIVGIADSGTADVIVRSPGYLQQRHSVRLGPSAFVLVDGSQSFRGSVSVNPPGKRSVEVSLGGVKADGSMSRVFNFFRRDTGPLEVTLTSSVANVVRPVVTMVTLPSGMRSAKFDVDIIAAGTATLRASAPGYPATPVLDELTYNVTAAPSTATKLFSCLGAGVTAALDMVSSQCVYTGTGLGTVTATVQDPTIVGLSFDDGPVGVSLSSPATPRVLRVHGLKVGQSVVVLSGPGVPSTTMSVSVVRPFLSFVEPASGTLNVARGSEGTVKLQALVENYSPGIYTMRPGANLQAIPLSTVGNSLTIRGTQGSEVRFAVGQDTAEFRVIAAEVGVTTLRLGYSGPFTAPPGGYKTEILVNSR